MEKSNQVPTLDETLDIVRQSLKPLVHYGFVEVINYDKAEYDCRKLENALHKNCAKMSWDNLMSWSKELKASDKTEPPSVVPKVSDWNFWTELAIITIRAMHKKIPKEHYKAVVYGFSTVAWMMAQDWKKGGQHYEDGTPFLKTAMKQGVERQLNMQKGFITLLK